MARSSLSRAARLLLLSFAALVVAAAARVVPAWQARHRGPTGSAAPARILDLCAGRRPDGTLPAACAAAGGDATLLFGGDTALADAALDTLRDRGIDFPFQNTVELLQTADLSVINLEAPVTDGEHPFRLGKEYVYRAPPEAAAAMALAGIDVAGVANNHVLDQGPEGLLDTLDRLARVGLATVGAGRDEAAARGSLVVRAGSLRVALLGRCERKLDWDLWVRQFAAPDRPGVAALDEALAADVAAARAEADLVVLLVHWGEGYAPTTDEQRRQAERAARAGVDLVIGHHPHVAQPLALVGPRRVPVAYSLGNYAFGTAGRPELDVGLLLRVTVRARHIARLELIPIDVQNRRVGYRPTPLAGPAAHAALAPLVAASRAEGAALLIDRNMAVLDTDQAVGQALGPALGKALGPISPTASPVGPVRKSMIPKWFSYLQGFAMLLMGVSLLLMRPRKKGDSFYARFVNLGTMWALICCAVGVALLAMALGYWSWSPAASPPPGGPPHRARHR